MKSASSKGFFTRRSQPANGESASDGLHPRRKRVPSRGLADWQTNLLDKNEKGSCPERRTLELAGRPQIIGSQQQQKSIRSDSGVCGIVEKPTHRKAGNGSDQHSHSCDVDDALVSRRVATSPEGEENQGPEDDHIGHWHDVEEIGVQPSRRGTTSQPVGGRNPAHDYHQASQQETGDAQLPVGLPDGSRGLDCGHRLPSGKPTGNRRCPTSGGYPPEVGHRRFPVGLPDGSRWPQSSPRLPSGKPTGSWASPVSCWLA